MMCIRGRLNPLHTGLIAGEVYDVDVVKFCECRPAAFAHGSVFKRPVTLRCILCRVVKVDYSGPVPWGPERFVPLKDQKDSVTTKETEHA